MNETQARTALTVALAAYLLPRIAEQRYLPGMSMSPTVAQQVSNDALDLAESFFDAALARYPDAGVVLTGRG